MKQLDPRGRENGFSRCYDMSLNPSSEPRGSHLLGVLATDTLELNTLRSQFFSAKRCCSSQDYTLSRDRSASTTRRCKQKKAAPLISIWNIFQVLSKLQSPHWGHLGLCWNWITTSLSLPIPASLTLCGGFKICPQILLYFFLQDMEFNSPPLVCRLNLVINFSE